MALGKITFHGAAGEVTGSMHLLEIGTKRILLDCGLFQGRREDANQKNIQFPAGVESVDAVILSHSHIDHCGRLPLLVAKGYKGPIYCTPATRDLSVIMLADAGHIQESDADFLRRRGKTDAVPLYTIADALHVNQQSITVPYDRPYDLFPGIRFSFTDAGHILGSASVVVEVDAPGGMRRIVFSADIGRSGLPIIRDPHPPAGNATDVLIIESTYANKVHESVEEAQQMLADHVNEVAKRGGKIYIPSFALGRTQEIVYELHGLALAKKIPMLPIYIDSPLAVNATDIFKLHPECLDDSEQLIATVPQIFQFGMVKYVRSVDESKALNAVHGPAIIISASGMAESGRIRHHLINGLPDFRNMVLLVGFQASYTLGARLQQGAKEVHILGQTVNVNAEVKTIAGYSAHGDKNDLTAWIQGLGPTPKHAFVVHGEAGLQAMAGILKDLGVPDVNVPQLHQSFDIA
ncbi:MAG TPA: MBL fold metallo-hydrolase [Gemmatimonadales bacterium]